MKTGAFFVSYLILMILTYVCRLVLMGILPESSSIVFWLPTIVLALIYVLMCSVAYKRGQTIEKSWLVTFPLVGGVFDVILVFIPFVPTVMNILGLVLGMIGSKKQA